MSKEELSKAIGQRLELVRLALDYPTQTAFAAALNREIPMTPQRWNNYVCARDRLTLDVALAMCRRFPVTLDWIFRGDASTLRSDIARKIEELTERRGAAASTRANRNL